MAGGRYPQAPAAKSTLDRLGSSAGTDEFAQDQGASTEIHLIYGGWGEGMLNNI